MTITITARSMHYAQGFKFDVECRAALKAKADRDRAELGETGPQQVNVKVVDFSGTHIGYIKVAA